MAKLILKNATVGGVLTDITIDRESGRILSVEKTAEAGRDLQGAAVIAGFVDIHAHGFIGHDVMDGDKLPEMSAFLASCGTTSWCPTTTTNALPELRAVLQGELPKAGAHVLGFHLEGPYISHKYCGALNTDYARLPSLADFEGLTDRVALMTLAPELEGALDYIKNAPFRISVGHTAANYDVAREAFRAGADCVTHIFNAMSPLHHRDPAVVGAALTEGAFVQVISDGIHLHPATVMALYRMFGSDRMLLISDAISAAGLSDGDYMLGGKAVIVRGGVARNEAGALSGSTVTMLDCVRRAISFGIPREEVLKMASETPARYLGVRKGRVAPGYDADLLIVDEELNVLETILCDQL
ncbi:MAG: N-acetylglucosamine-6-phosphate deacetylase [Ruminococcaceae bacterium]|nr:N-acetylglucosamine-6-phosphate deacetylase [Oscillospiraceae bacterium]